MSQIEGLTTLTLLFLKRSGYGFHTLFPDGVYVEQPDGTLLFRQVKAPTGAELILLLLTSSEHEYIVRSRNFPSVSGYDGFQNTAVR